MLITGTCVVALVAAVVVSALVGKRGLPPLPAATAAHPAFPQRDPFAYNPARAAEFVERATDGNAQVLFLKSPGGVLATAARVAAYRPLIDAETSELRHRSEDRRGDRVPRERGTPKRDRGQRRRRRGRTDADRGADRASLARDAHRPARSGNLTRRIEIASAQGRMGVVARLERDREAVDDRFSPALALAATIRYLELAERHFGRVPRGRFVSHG